MKDQSLQIERSRAVAHIWLNQPDVHNAFDGELIEELTRSFEVLAADARVRVIVLAARGKSFSAGARVEWMAQQGAATTEENMAGAVRLATLFETIAECPKPTIARVQGAAIGGGIGLVSACDIAVGVRSAVFATSEVRLGLIPATIAPYVVRAIGPRHASRIFLTAEKIDAATAERIGLLHEAVDDDQLDERIAAVTNALLMGGPNAQAAAKTLIRFVAGKPVTAELLQATAERIAKQRSGEEAKAGLAAFLEKRSPDWSERS